MRQLKRCGETGATSSCPDRARRKHGHAVRRQDEIEDSQKLEGKRDRRQVEFAGLTYAHSRAVSLRKNCARGKRTSVDTRKDPVLSKRFVAGAMTG